MAIPAFDELMLPLLRYLGERSELSFAESVELLASDYSLTEDELAQMLPSGRYPLFRNRVGWASTYLTKAELIEKPRRGFMAILPSGRTLLAERPERIDIKLLERYATFREFRGRSGEPPIAPPPGKSRGAGPGPIKVVTPEETIANGFKQHRAALVDDVLERVRKVTPKYFEQVVVDVLVAMGYGGTFQDAATVVGRTNDKGIDGVIKVDRLGLDAIYVQAKRWNDAVGSPIVAGFLGALVNQQSSKGVLITTSTFTKQAEDFVRQVSQRVILIDGRQLAELMVEHGVGVAPIETFVLQRLDNDYFDEGQ